MIDCIDGVLFQKMVIHASACINAQKQSINELNVFPVPDGDTGTNMSLTIGTAAAEAKNKPTRQIGQAASINASALLRGARGNSGVILSLLFRGIARTLKEMDTADGLSFAQAMTEGVQAAYKAVMKPAEGTILTVSRVSAAAANETALQCNSVEAVLETAIRTGEAALQETVNQNPVLKKAGVIDAGGKGLVIILQGMLDELRGVPLPENPEETEEREKADFASISQEDITFTYDTVFVVRGISGRDLEQFRRFLNTIGDSLVIGEDEDSIKVHVHTDLPGAALTESQKYGTLELAKIENMRTQAEDLAAGRKTHSTDDLEENPSAAPGPEEGSGSAEPEKKFGAVAVCAGEGMTAIFRDLGVDRVISGGQTMNPSTSDILREIQQTPAEIVYVLPNNKNIIMAAEQCVRLVRDKKVIVLPTATIPQGISAMLMMDPFVEEEENTAVMSSALRNVRTTEVTIAARDSGFDGMDIHEGDYLALQEGKLFGTDQSLTGLLERLALSESQQTAEFINLYYGEEIAPEDADRTAEMFRRSCPDAEITVLSGGQPIYYYLISAE